MPNRRMGNVAISVEVRSPFSKLAGLVVGAVAAVGLAVVAGLGGLPVPGVGKAPLLAGGVVGGIGFSEAGGDALTEL